MANEDLLVEVGLSESQYRAALARMEAQTVKSAKKQEKTFKAANTNIVSSFDRANKGANVFASHGLRNVSMQLSQVAQQGQVTGNYLQALAIQLPDIGLAFGTIGIAAGVAAGAILPLIANTESSVDAAKEAKTAVEAYMNAVSRMREAVALADTSLADLTQRYGENAEAAREAAVIQAKIAAAGAERDAQAAFATVNAQREEIDNLILRYDEILLRQERTKQLVEAQEAPSNQLVRIEGERALLAQQIETITGRNVDDQRELSSLIGQMVDAMSDGTITEEFRSAAERALELARATGEVDPELEKALDRAIQLELTEAEIKKLTDLIAGSASNAADMIGRAAGNALVLASNMNEAAAAFSRVQAQQSKAYSGRGGDPRDFMEGGSQSDYESEQGYTTVDEIVSSMTPKTKSGGSSGSSGGGGINEDLREAQRLFDETRTDAENYAAEVERIQELHAKGLLDEETFTRALDMVAEEYDQAAQAADAFAEVSGMFGDAIIDAAMGGTEAMEDLAKSIQRAVLQAALLGEGPLAGLFSGLGTGGLLGNITSGLNIPSFDGGGYTGSGARSGGVDGRGGQLAVLHPNETVIDHTKGGGMGSSIVYSPTIDARGASEEAVAKLAAVIAEDRRNFSRNVQGVLKTSGLRGR